MSPLRPDPGDELHRRVEKLEGKSEETAADLDALFHRLDEVLDVLERLERLSVEAVASMRILREGQQTPPENGGKQS